MAPRGSYRYEPRTRLTIHGTKVKTTQQLHPFGVRLSFYVPAYTKYNSNGGSPVTGNCSCCAVAVLCCAVPVLCWNAVLCCAPVIHLNRQGLRPSKHPNALHYSQQPCLHIYLGLTEEGFRFKAGSSTMTVHPKVDLSKHHVPHTSHLALHHS